MREKTTYKLYVLKKKKKKKITSQYEEDNRHEGVTSYLILVTTPLYNKATTDKNLYFL